MKFKNLTVYLFVFIFVFCVPFQALAAVNEDAYDYVYTSDNYEKIAPDMHYILNDELPYKALFFGNNHIPVDNSASAFYQLQSYDYVFVQTASQPIAVSTIGANLELSGDNHFSVYAANRNDYEWTEILDYGVARYGVYLSLSDDEKWDSYIFASNWNPVKALNKQATPAEDYLIYLYSDYSFVDYNGHLTYANLYLVYLKSISHSFVLRFLKPLFDIIVNEPILFIICLIGLSVSLVSLLYKVFTLIINKKKLHRKR